MLDEFRRQAEESRFFDEEPEEPVESSTQVQRQFLGMTPGQRLVVALILLTLTCLLSTFCLLITERVVPPFL